MEDQGKETGIDEDVEGHVNIRSPKATNKLANDEGEDVEGHVNIRSPKATNKLANDEGDDVEGHMHKNAPHKGSHKL